MKVPTRAVRNRVVGEARKALKAAAGSNGVLSKTEAKKLKKDVARAAETVRAGKRRVTVNDAVDAYARKVTSVLTAVDTRARGDLSAAEVKRIRDPDLRASVLDVRGKMTVAESGGMTGAGTASSALITAMKDAMANLEAYHESGDHGVNITLRKVPGRTLAEAVAKLHLDPATPWTHAEAHVVLAPAGTVAATVAEMTQFAREVLEAERDDMPDVVETFTSGVKAQFGALSDVRLATGKDLGTSYLIGKTTDGYVALAVQRYQD